MKLILIFITLSLANVVVSTIRSIVTINGNKTVASLINGAYFAFYNIVLIYSVADFPMWQKCLITFVCNVIGVYLVKLFEEKTRKDKLWQIDFTINNQKEDFELVYQDVKSIGVPCQYFDLGKHTKFTCYAETSAQSEQIAKVIRKYNGKYFAIESEHLM